MPRRLLALLGAAALLLTGCANTSSPVNRRPHDGVATASASSAGIQQITIKAGDDFRFDPSTFYVHPGKVRVTLIHTGTGAPHDFQVTDFPGDFIPLLTAQGEQASTTFIAPAPGRYQFVCTIHLQQGQTGTMVVLPK